MYSNTIEREREREIHDPRAWACPEWKQAASGIQIHPCTPNHDMTFQKDSLEPAAHLVASFCTGHAHHDWNHINIQKWLAQTNGAGIEMHTKWYMNILRISKNSKNDKFSKHPQKLHARVQFSNAKIGNHTYHLKLFSIHQWFHTWARYPRNMSFKPFISCMTWRPNIMNLRKLQSNMHIAFMQTLMKETKMGVWCSMEWCSDHQILHNTFHPCTSCACLHSDRWCQYVWMICNLCQEFFASAIASWSKHCIESEPSAEMSNKQSDAVQWLQSCNAGIWHHCS